MSLIKKLNYHDDLLLEKEKILMSKGKTERRLSVNHVLSEEDLKEWKNSFSAELAILRDWLKKQPHLPQNVTDELLLTFLHTCYGSCEQAKGRIDSFFTIRTHAPEIFKNRNIISKEMEKAQKITRISPLPCATPEGYNAIFIDSMDADVANFNFSEAIKVASITIDVLIRYYPNEEGNILVFDMQRSALAHVIKTNLSVLKKALIFAEKALPFRLVQVHVINAFPLINQIQMMMKPFLSEKMSKLIHIHTQDNKETLYQYIPKKNLPKEYGGEAESLQELNDKLKEMIHLQEPYLKNLESLVVDESKRAGRAQTSNDVFGMEGSFRKLDID